MAMYHRPPRNDLLDMTRRGGGQPREIDGRSMRASPDEVLPVVIATILRAEGSTGVQTHVRQVHRYLEGCGRDAELVTPFSWGRWLTVPVFGARLLLERLSRAASVAWYRHWHEAFVRNALRRTLARTGAC